MSQKDLAAALNRPVQVINGIINAKKAVTPETALELERALGIGAHVWTGLESTYRLTLARSREREQLRAALSWPAEFPVREMAERGWIARVRDKEEQVRELLRFFGVANVSAYRTRISAIGFHFTDNAKMSEGALAAWLRRGEIEAASLETGPLKQALLEVAATEARALTLKSPDVFAPRLRSLFADAGVAFVVVPELPKTGANGAARRLSTGKALIQLNLRYRWADIFWFTLFHEVAHLLKHSKARDGFVDGGSISGDPAIEAEANRWAADFLIEPCAWREFAGDGVTQNSVLEFASEQGIAPGIVVGRLQREGIIPYSHMTGLKQRFAWVETSS